MERLEKAPFKESCDDRGIFLIYLAGAAKREGRGGIKRRFYPLCVCVWVLLYGVYVGLRAFKTILSSDGSLFFMLFYSGASALRSKFVVFPTIAFVV